MAKAKRSINASREAKAAEIRRGIRAAQLRVALDKSRGRKTPDAVVRLSNLELPALPITIIEGGRVAHEPTFRTYEERDASERDASEQAPTIKAHRRSIH